MSLLTAPFVKNSHIYAEIYSKKHPEENLKVFQNQILNLVKRSEKQLPGKANFSTFLQLGCSNFRLKLCETPQSYQNCQRN